MTKFKNVQDALQAIDDDAEERVWVYLEEETYGGTEEKTRHKIKLVVAALVKERDGCPCA